MSFSKDIKKFSRKVEDRADKVRRMAFIQLSSNVIRRSPVGDADFWKNRKADGTPVKPKGYTGGRFRANWQASINSPKREAIDTDDSPQTSAATSVGSVKGLRHAKRAKSFYLMNNLPYSKRLEDGHSRQAREGIVKVAVAEWASIVKIVNMMVK